jgi:hypothetical protein
MLKIKPEHFEVLSAAIGAILAAKPEAAAAYQKAGLSHERFRWDVLRASKIKIGDSVGMPGDLPLYDYMSDSHIDSALRAIVPPFVV